MNIIKNNLLVILMALSVGFLSSCSDDEDTDTDQGTLPTGKSEEYTMDGTAPGLVRFEEMDDASTKVTIVIQVSGSANHPAHIHMNSFAVTGGIVIDLNAVSFETGMSETFISTTNDGTAISYEELIAYNGYVNVHNSAEDLGTSISHGDIGLNALTGESKAYILGANAIATFHERSNGFTLVEISIVETPTGSDYASHIHMNTAAETGGIVISLTNVVDGVSMTHVAATDGMDGIAITYAELLEYDGYINVHGSEGLIAQGDIGQNELTGMSTTYALTTGTATFSERVNAETLVEININGLDAGSDYASHIHMSTAATSGGIVISLSNVMDGLSKTNVSALDDNTAITYTEMIAFDGYINVHGASLIQGDIGQNALTGMSTTYTLSMVNESGISGEAKFEERNSGKTLITITLSGTVEGQDHANHIHDNDVATTGGVALTLSTISGTTGIAKTDAVELDDATTVSYSDLTGFNGYINIHGAGGVSVASGDIGSNVN